mmetsp:Transcript_53038/g.124204  ORF Transcript_53038/g.124204 Transcript_53038/m.124204 type:complete len:277 (+) Transcript_53038:235-1065(+)
MLSSCFIWSFIRSTSASAFMRAMMSLTFCLSLGLSTSFLGRPCASAHLMSFCCLDSGLLRFLLCLAVAFLSASFWTAAFLAEWSWLLSHLASSAGFSCFFSLSLRSASSLADILREECRSCFLVWSFFMSLTPSSSALSLAALLFSASWLALCFSSFAPFCSFLTCLPLESWSFIQSASFFGSAAVFSVSSCTCLSCLVACRVLLSLLFFAAVTMSLPASLMAFWLSLASSFASRPRACFFADACAGACSRWWMLLSLIESVWLSSSFFIASILSW